MRRYVIICMSIICVILLLTSCKNSKNVEGNNKQVSSVHIMSFIQNVEEHSDFTDQPKGFQVIANIKKTFDDNTQNVYIVCELTIDKPKKQMKNVYITSVFNTEINKYLLVDYPYISNRAGEAVTIFPNKYPKGMVVGRAFIAKKTVDDTDDLKDLFTNMKTKITWEDQSGKRHSEYIMLDKDEISLDKSVITYFQKSIKNNLKP
ncbi:MAG TPA: hypothetical protein VFK44_05085 [Bacillales bacterium]|nr:hypothetical protein [Bacillales bacterium]